MRTASATPGLLPPLPRTSTPHGSFGQEASIPYDAFGNAHRPALPLVDPGGYVVLEAGGAEAAGDMRLSLEGLVTGLT